MNMTKGMTQQRFMKTYYNIPKTDEEITVSITIRETTITVNHDCAENEGASGRSIDNDLLIWEVADVVNINYCPYCGERLPQTVATAREMAAGS